MIDQLLASLSQSAHFAQHCLENNRDVDYYLQEARDRLVRAFTPTTKNYVALDLSPMERSVHANTLQLRRWRDAALGYAVSISPDAALQRDADRHKVLFRAGVDPRDDFNRFHLIDATFALDRYWQSNALAQFLETMRDVLLPGGHLVCSLRANTGDAAAMFVQLATSYYGFRAVTDYPSSLWGQFCILDIAEPVKRLNTQLNTASLECVVVSPMYHFIVLTRQ